MESNVCKGLIASAADQLILEAAVADTLPKSWTIRPLAPGEQTFELLPSDGRALTEARGWEFAHLLAKQRDIAWAEPALVVAIQIPSEPKSAKGPQHLPSAESNPDWSHQMIGLLDAWQRVPPVATGKTKGEGIRIGHPDTGYTAHTALIDSLLPGEGFDYLDEDGDPRDELDSGVLRFPGHGTSTGGVIVGRHFQPAQALKRWMRGVAPKAKLVPLRVSKSVIHFDFANVAKAILFATNKGCHVISMSLGGPFASKALRRAVQYATERGVIVMAAAGNYYPWVVFPAAFDETIAVAACNADRLPWKWSAKGEAVDFTAPGESVWVARTEGDAQHPEFGVDMGSGTSFAVAHSAGAAALWLAFHDRDVLIEKYGAANLAAVFKELVTSAAVKTPMGWDTDRYGAGILDADALLAAPLPASAPAVSAPKSIPRNDFDFLLHLLPEAKPEVVRRGLLKTFGVTEAELNPLLFKLGDELRSLIATDEALRSALAKGKAAQAKARLAKRGSKRLKAQLSAPERAAAPRGASKGRARGASRRRQPRRRR